MCLLIIYICRNLLKLYGSSEFVPLLTAQDGQPSRVMDIIPIPVLHCIKLGPVNHIIKALCEVYPGVDDRLCRMHLVMSAYHGGQYEGRECSILLNNIE